MEARLGAEACAAIAATGMTDGIEMVCPSLEAVNPTCADEAPSVCRGTLARAKFS